MIQRSTSNNRTLDGILQNMKKTLDMKNFDFVVDHGMSIKLSDQVVIYSSGDKYKIVPLLYCLSYPVIHDKDENDDVQFDTTIVVCPVTLRTAKFFGTFIFHSYQNTTLMLEEKNTDNLLFIDSSQKINKKLIIEPVKRYEVKITTLRNALMTAPNLFYMILKPNIKLSSVVEMAYYTDDKDINYKSLEYFIHPKTLCYVIQKKKFGSEKEKVYIVLGKDAVSNNITGYDTKKSGITNYLTTNSEKIARDNSYIFPILWCVAKNEYPTSKVVYLAHY